MKLIVQIPCYNEEKTLPLVLSTIPKSIQGISEIETLVIDDGSSDKTSEIARNLGVNHIVRHKQNKGLAAAFAAGINTALKLGADIIVNTDGDNQYPQQEIPRLIKPILDGTHDMVIADRQVTKVKEFSPIKKLLQIWGSSLVRALSGTKVPDAPSGFRAFSKEAAMQLNIVTDFSYVIETVVQAGRKRIATTHVQVVTNPKTRESRLFKSIFEHIKRSAAAVLRSYAMYTPFRIFLVMGVVVLAIGAIPYLWFGVQSALMGEPLGGHVHRTFAL